MVSVPRMRGGSGFSPKRTGSTVMSSRSFFTSALMAAVTSVVDFTGTVQVALMISSFAGSSARSVLTHIAMTTMQVDIKRTVMPRLPYKMKGHSVPDGVRFADDLCLRPPKPLQRRHPGTPGLDQLQ